MADGTLRKEFGRTAPEKPSTGLKSTDADKLRAIRAGIMISLTAQVDIANRIHNSDMRDAALGNLVKRHTRTVRTSPAHMSQLNSEVDTLFKIADMMADDTKRLGMFAYIEKLASENK